MRIKFLPLIAIFLTMSIVATSCLDSDNNNIYSPDATIRAFALDTIGRGINYKFSIDQLKGEIYNQDSLPVHADTIIDRILIKTLTTSSGVVTVKSKNGNDSILNIKDSVDLRKPLIIKVWSTEAVAGVAPGHTKEYTISVRVHRHDPDSLRWTYEGNIGNGPTGEQKSVMLGDDLLIYSVTGGQLTLYRAEKDKTANWSTSTVSNAALGNALPTSLIAFKEKLYATPATPDGKVYESADGMTWAESALFNGEQVSLLLAPLGDKITYIKIADNKKVFGSTDRIGTAAAQLQEVPGDFPIGKISYTTYTTATGKEGIMLVGQYKEQPTIDSNTTIVPWGYMGDSWASFPPSTIATSCPELTNPTIIYYNDQFHLFGEGFETFYVSDSGLVWKEANKKFRFPRQDWSQSGFVPSVERPEFRGRGAYSAVSDTETKRIYILFSAGEAAFNNNTHRYSYTSEVWSGRLNQLWFDLANAGK